MDKVRLGIIGCGRNMRGHLRRLLTFEDVDIVAVAEPVRENFDQAVSEIEGLEGVSHFSRYQDMLEKAAIDAVEISTPHNLHFEHAGAALNAGLHTLVEKPMVCTVEEAKELIRIRDRSGKHLIVNYQRHFRPVYRYCHERFASGAWSPPHHILAWQAQDWRSSNTGKWRQDPKVSGGGQLNDSGSHLIDILLWTTGLEPQEVYVYIDNRGLQVDVLSAVSVRFRNGAIGNISIVGDSHTGLEEGLYFWHDRGMAEITGELHPRLVLREPEERVVDESELPEASTPDRNFIDAVLGKDDIRSTAESALGVIQLTEAIWESARRGAPVAIER